MRIHFWKLQVAGYRLHGGTFTLQLHLGREVASYRLHRSTLSYFSVVIYIGKNFAVTSCNLQPREAAIHEQALEYEVVPCNMHLATCNLQLHFKL